MNIPSSSLDKVDKDDFFTSMRNIALCVTGNAWALALKNQGVSTGKIQAFVLVFGVWVGKGEGEACSRGQRDSYYANRLQARGGTGTP